MQKCLYLLCPTDCLESIINNHFQHENYFYTSLGNSFNANSDTISRIKCVIQKHQIKKICFVLANDNKIISDAITNQDFSDIQGLRNFHTEIVTQKEQSVVITTKRNKQFFIISNYLNKVMQKALVEFNDASIEMSAKVYSRKKEIFIPTYSNLTNLTKHQLN